MLTSVFSCRQCLAVVAVALTMVAPAAGAPQRRDRAQRLNEVWDPSKHLDRLSFKTLLKALTRFNGLAKSQQGFDEYSLPPDSTTSQGFLDPLKSEGPPDPSTSPKGLPEPFKSPVGLPNQSTSAENLTDPFRSLEGLRDPSTPPDNLTNPSTSPENLTDPSTSQEVLPDPSTSQEVLPDPSTSPEGFLGGSDELLDVPTPGPLEDDALNIKPIVKPDKTYRFTHNFRFGYGALPGLP